MVKRQQNSEQNESYLSNQQKYESESQQSNRSSNEQKYMKQQHGSDSQQNSNQDQDSDQYKSKLNHLQKEQLRIKQQLKQLPYGLILKQKLELEKQKNDVVNKKKQAHKRKGIKKQQEVKKDKHAPKQMEIHKKPPKKVVSIFQSTRQKTIDPRFQNYAGSYNQDLAMKSFDFIPKIQEQQIAALRNTLDKSKKATNKRSNKRLSQPERKKLTEQYNRLTNQKRQIQLLSIQKEAKHNIRQKQQERYRSNNSNQRSYGSYGRESGSGQWNRNRNDQYSSNRTFIHKKEFKEQFQKVKQSRMSQEGRKQYLKDKQKKLLKNQQIQRNNLMFETSRAFRRDK